jgi:hypothetical protein
MPRDDLDDGLVYGFASVAEHSGEPVVDAEGDTVSEAELVKAAHDFMTNSRTGGVMHLKTPDGGVVEAGQIVDSLVLTAGLQKALGIDLGCVPWIVCLKVSNPAVRKAVAQGKLRGFSVGGAGIRTPLS